MAQKNTYTFVFIVIENVIDIRYLIPDLALSEEHRGFLRRFECGTLQADYNSTLDTFYNICRGYELGIAFNFENYMENYGHTISDFFAIYT